MKKETSIYDKEGRINDPELSRNMAEIEDKYHEKNPSKGEKLAEKYLERESKEISFSDLPEVVQNTINNFTSERYKKTNKIMNFFYDKVVMSAGKNNDNIYKVEGRWLGTDENLYPTKQSMLFTYKVIGDKIVDEHMEIGKERRANNQGY